MTRALLLLPLALLLGGCAGGDEAADETTTDSVTVTLPALSTARVYWLRDGKVWPAAREVEASGEPGAAVLDELLAGPTDDDPAESETAIPAGTEAGDLAVEDGVARITPSSALSDEALAQVVYTLTDLPGVDSVEIDGQSYTRADFEDQTPCDPRRVAAALRGGHEPARASPARRTRSRRRSSTSSSTPTARSWTRTS